MTDKKNQTDLTVKANSFRRDMSWSELRSTLQRHGFIVDGGWYVTHAKLPELKIGIAKIDKSNREKVKWCVSLLTDCSMAVRKRGTGNDPQRNAQPSR